MLLAYIVCGPPAVLLPVFVPVLTVKLLVVKAVTASVTLLEGEAATSMVIQK